MKIIKIVDSMDKVLGQVAVVSFKRGVTKNISEITEDVMVIEMARRANSIYN